MLRFIIFLWFFKGSQGGAPELVLSHSVWRAVNKECAQLPACSCFCSASLLHLGSSGMPTWVFPPQSTIKTALHRHVHSQPHLIVRRLRLPPQAILGYARLKFRTSCHKCDHSCVHQRGCDAMETLQVRSVNPFSCLRRGWWGSQPSWSVLTVLYLGGALPTLGKQMLLGGSTWSHLTLGFWTRCKEAKIESGGESIAGTPNVAVSFLEFYVCLLAVVVDAWPLLRLSAKSGWDVCKGNHGVAVFWVV